MTVNGVNGVEVRTTPPLGAREALDLCRASFFVTMLDRERADFLAALEQLPLASSPSAAWPCRSRSGTPELKGIVDLFLRARTWIRAPTRESSPPAIRGTTSPPRPRSTA